MIIKTYPDISFWRAIFKIICCYQVWNGNISSLLHPESHTLYSLISFHLIKQIPVFWEEVSIWILSWGSCVGIVHISKNVPHPRRDLLEYGNCFTSQKDRITQKYYIFKNIFFSNSAFIMLLVLMWYWTQVPIILYVYLNVFKFNFIACLA